MDDWTAERILTASAAGGSPLERIVRAAGMAGDPTAAVPGEDLAVAAFRSARAAAGSRLAAGRARSVWTRALVVKVSVLTMTLVAAGVAVAAGVGALPGQVPYRPRPVDSVTSAATPPATAGDRNSAIPALPHGTTPPDVAGLCRAFQAEAVVDRAAASRNPRFIQLLATAGGLDRVDGYCSAVLDTPAGGHGQGSPVTPPGHPSSGPHPTGKRSAAPRP